MNERLDEFRTAIAQVLTAFEDVIGPKGCPTHGHELTECDDDCTPQPEVSVWYLRDWAVVTGYQRIDPDGEEDDWFDVTPARQTTTWAARGLLQQAADTWTQ